MYNFVYRLILSQIFFIYWSWFSRNNSISGATSLKALRKESLGLEKRYYCFIQIGGWSGQWYLKNTQIAYPSIFSEQIGAELTPEGIVVEEIADMKAVWPNKKATAHWSYRDQCIKNRKMYSF